MFGMKTYEEKRWEMMQNCLMAEYSGDARPAVRSARTLFGIKSHVEEVIERTVRETEESNASTPDADESQES